MAPVVPTFCPRTPCALLVPVFCRADPLWVLSVPDAGPETPLALLALLVPLFCLDGPKERAAFEAMLPAPPPLLPPFALTAGLVAVKLPNWVCAVNGLLRGVTLLLPPLVLPEVLAAAVVTTCASALD